MPPPKCDWIALGYSVPANPSRNRVYVWRRLQAMGAQSLRPGAALLPHTRENRTRFEALAEKIAAFGGEAHLFELNFLTPADNAAMRRRFAEAAEEEYRHALDECAALLAQLRGEEDDARRAALERRLQKALGRCRQSPLRALGNQAAGELGAAGAELMAALRAMPTELSALLRPGEEADDQTPFPSR